MNPNQLSMLREAQLALADETVRLCRAHGIPLYMIGGTLLGAVRHRGFIPWDPDIDFAMPRDGYERFRRVCGKELDPRFRYLDRRSEKDFNHPHALLAIRGTKLFTKYDRINPRAKNPGIYIDLFPLDVSPEDDRLAARQAASLRRLRMLKKLRVDYAYSPKPWKRAARLLIRILLAPLTVGKLNRMLEKRMRQYEGTGSRYICSMASHFSYEKQRMEQSVYGEAILLPFEGRMWPAPRETDAVLGRIYGDYLRLPSEEQRRESLGLYVGVDFGTWKGTDAKGGIA